jgi:hypothetical protein
MTIFIVTQIFYNKIDYFFSRALHFTINVHAVANNSGIITSIRNLFTENILRTLWNPMQDAEGLLRSYYMFLTYCRE